MVDSGMAFTCQQCSTFAAGITLPYRCPACGRWYGATNPVARNTADADDPTGPPVAPPDTAAGDDADRVRELLSRIARQSHFEERYEVHGELASGGMGSVLRASDRILRRQVAIKMMRSGLEEHADDAIRGQFLKEARVGGRLLHPNILPVFDLGVNQQHQIYYSMRLVDGVNLRSCLADLSSGVATRFIDFPFRRLIDTICGICQGVDFAHQNRILHLDLKPNNVLVSGFSEVFVIDRGLARVDDEDDTERLLDLYRGATGSSELTATGVGANGRVVGTPAYMSPEQARGLIASYCPATDVYGLGGILYFILYSLPPNGTGSTLQMVAESTLPKSRRPLRTGIIPRGRRIPKSHVDGIAALEDICLKALSPEPKDRYPDADAMLVELNEWRAANP